MNVMNPRFRAALLVGAALSCLSLSAAAGEEAFVLEEALNRSWRNEAVSFPLTAAQRKEAEAGRPLLNGAGEPVRYQLVSEGEKPRILFQTDLAPLSRAAWHFGEGKAKAPESDLRVEETPETIRITNARAGLSIRRKPAEGEGPIEGIRLLSGKWGGESAFAPAAPLASWSVEVVERGPVRTRVLCRGTAGGGESWELRFTLLAGEPEILVDERFSLPGEWSLSFADRFRPENLYYRSYPKGRGQVVTPAVAEPAEADAGPLFLWEPWSSWWLGNSGKWFGAYDGSDFLAFGARDSEVWVDPQAPANQRRALYPKVTGKDGVLSIPFALGKGERRWLIAAIDRNAALADAQAEKPTQAPLPQQSVIRYEFPLERIKDYTLRWKADDTHPMLFINAEGVAKLRAEAPEEGVTAPKGEIRINTLDTFVPYYLKTGDPETGAALARVALEFVQESVNDYFEQTRHYSFGFAPHHSPWLPAAANVADAVLGTGVMTGAEEARLRAQAAFLGYTLMRPDYWSPERGFSANPNMTTMVASYQVGYGCLLRSHPEAKGWAETGLRELKRELDEWSDDNGGWLEAPHYAMASYDYILGCFIMARNCGFADHVYDPKMKRVLEWFAKITTPPDARLQGRRHFPPIGNTYRFEPTSAFGNGAVVWKERDPAFSAQLQWMHRQQGSPTDPGVGGRWPVMQGYRSFFYDDSLPETAPAYTSELFPETGVVLRNRYASGHETMLYLIAGSHYQHYDYDSGSITLWGKGEAIADDFGYHSRAPIMEHSMVETPYSNGLDMRIETFAPSQDADYVRGKLENWSRQILFAKDEDPLAPNYFFITDTMLGAAPATWRLWLTGPNVTLEPGAARFSGEGKVDADIVFLQPQEAELKMEELTRNVYGLGGDGKYGKQAVTLHGLSARAKTRQFAVLIYPRLKEEKAPKITPLAEGRGVKVETEAGTDYLFQSEKEFTYKEEGKLAFQGTAGAIRIRGRNGVLSLGEKGSVSYQGTTLQSDKPARKPW